MAKLTVTAKIRIAVSKEQEPNLIDTMNKYRDACNFVSDYVFRTRCLKQFALNEELYDSLRNKFNMKSQMAQSVLRTVIAKYKTIIENKQKWTLVVFKKPQLDLVWNRDYSLKKLFFSVNTLQGRIKVGYYNKGLEKYFDKKTYKFGTAKLVFKHGKWYLHIPATSEVKECTSNDFSNVVGIDRGVNFIVATYDSKRKFTFVNGRAVKQKRAHYKKVRQQLQKAQTPSSRRRLKAIGHRENRWMHDVNHCVSKALVEQNPKNTLFVLEELTGIRGATEKVRVKDRYVMVSWAFYDLEQKLTYKAAANNCAVIKVPPQYTSQRCPMCGHIERANRDKKLHIFKCKSCGYTSNDDRIGAMNLHRMGINYLVSKQKVPDAVV